MEKVVPSETVTQSMDEFMLDGFDDLGDDIPMNDASAAAEPATAPTPAPAPVAVKTETEDTPNVLEIPDKPFFPKLEVSQDAGMKC